MKYSIFAVLLIGLAVLWGIGVLPSHITLPSAVLPLLLLLALAYWIERPALSRRALYAGRLILVDSAGRPRAMLNTGTDESVALNFWDRQGVPRAQFGLDPGGAATLSFYYEDGTRSVGLGIDLKGSANLSLADRAGDLRAGISVWSDGSPVLWLMGEDGKPIFTVPPVIEQ